MSPWPIHHVWLLTLVRVQYSSSLVSKALSDRRAVSSE